MAGEVQVEYHASWATPREVAWPAASQKGVVRMEVKVAGVRAWLIAAPTQEQHHQTLDHA